MNQGPPCPNCGSLLRWYSDPQQWGCDTCRVMFPPQVMIHPQDYATGAPRHKRAVQGRTPAKKWRPLPLVIAGLVLVGGATGVTLRLLRKPAPSVTDLASYPDRDTAVRETFRALAAGDLEALIARSGTGLTRMIVTCDEAHEPTAADQRAAAALVRDQLTHAIDHAKGASFSVGKIDEPTPAKVIAKGEPMSRGCKLLQPHTTHTLAVQLEQTRNGKAMASDATLVVTEVAGRFFVAAAPKLGGCDAAIAQLVMVQAEATKLEAPLVAACTEDAWPAKVVECVAHALQLLPDVKSCLRDLDANQLAHVRTSIAAVPALAGIAPEAEANPKIDPHVTLGAARPLGIADLWIAPRSDGAFVVTSPIVSATFPFEPTAKVTRSAKPNAGGKPFDLYTIAASSPGAVYELVLIAMGRSMRDRGELDQISAELAKHGTVTKLGRTDGTQPVTRFTVRSSGVELVVDARIDAVRGVLATSKVNGAQSPATDAFLGSVHLLGARDAFEDPTTLAGIRARNGSPAQKGRFVLHDPDDSFTLEVPAKPEIKRTVDLVAHAVVVTATSTQKRAKYVVTISELSAWDALAIGPTKLAELQSKKAKAIVIWNPLQHRLFRLVCTDTPCDVIAKSLHFADPVADATATK